MHLPEASITRLRDVGVVVAYVFGSRARGRARPDSDLDLAVLLRDGIPAPGLMEEEVLAAGLAEELGVDRVDLVVLDRAPLELRARVLREGRVVFSDDEPARVRFEVMTQSRWFDVAPAHAEQTRAYLARVAREGLRG